MQVVHEKRSGLIIQPGAVGDVILTLPLVRLLKRQVGMEKVDLMGHTEPLELLVGRSDIDETLPIETIELHKLFEDHAGFDLPEGDRLIELFRPYEIIVTFLNDPQGNFEQNLLYTAVITHSVEVMELKLKPPSRYRRHAAHYYLEQFVKQFIPARRQNWDEYTTDLIQPGPSEIDTGKKLLAEKRVNLLLPKVLVHPGSGDERKRWPLKNFQRLAALLAQEGVQVIFLVGPVEQERWGVEAIRGLDAQVPVFQGLTLTEVAGLLMCCDGYVGNDSGISHLAAAIGVNTISIFGASQVRHWKPMGNKVKVCQTKGKGKNRWPDVEKVLEEIKEML